MAPKASDVPCVSRLPFSIIEFLRDRELFFLRKCGDVVIIKAVEGFAGGGFTPWRSAISL